MPYCENCKHFLKDWTWVDDKRRLEHGRCTLSMSYGLRLDLVAPKEKLPVDAFQRASIARMEGHSCGPAGIRWEPLP